jgi:hypothetical protein
MKYGVGSYGKQERRKGSAEVRTPPKEAVDRHLATRARIIPRRRDVGESPPYFQIQGYKASDLEWRVYLMLKRLGWTDKNIVFQSDVMGGRMPGGQVLDFVVYSPQIPVVIVVNGDYWHARDQKQKDYEKYREALVRKAWGSRMKYLALYSGDLVDDATAYRNLLREVGKGI